MKIRAVNSTFVILLCCSLTRRFEWVSGYLFPNPSSLVVAHSFLNSKAFLSEDDTKDSIRCTLPTNRSRTWSYNSTPFIAWPNLLFRSLGSKTVRICPTAIAAISPTATAFAHWRCPWHGLKTPENTPVALSIRWVTTRPAVGSQSKVSHWQVPMTICKFTACDPLSSHSQR